MTDIIEAAKFYRQCLEDVHKAILKQDIIPNNEFLHVRADLMAFNGKYREQRIVGVFKLNGQEYDYNIPITDVNNAARMREEVVISLGQRIADLITNKILLEIT